MHKMMILGNDALGLSQSLNPQLPNLELQVEAQQWYDTSRIRIRTRGRNTV